MEGTALVDPETTSPDPVPTCAKCRRTRTMSIIAEQCRADPNGLLHVPGGPPFRIARPPYRLPADPFRNRRIPILTNEESTSVQPFGPGRSASRSRPHASRVGGDLGRGEGVVLCEGFGGIRSTRSRRRGRVDGVDGNRLNRLASCFSAPGMLSQTARSLSAPSHSSEDTRGRSGRTQRP